MASTVKWRADRGSWYLYTYANGTAHVEKFGPTAADKRRAAREARKTNRLQREGKLGLTKPGPKPILFGDFADQWFRAKLRLPLQRGEEGCLRPKTVAMRDEMLRLHLKPYLGSLDLREIKVATLEGFGKVAVRQFKRRSILTRAQFNAHSRRNALRPEAHAPGLDD